MNTWFSVGVKYTKQLEDGTLKRVSEKYLVNAIGFTEAEARIHQEVGEFVRGEFIVTSEKKEDFSDIIQFEENVEEWYKCKVLYTTEDLDSGKEKKVINNFLVSGKNINEVSKNLNSFIKDGRQITNFKITKVELSNIVEVFAYKSIDDELE